jgi:hypothetical protein
MCHGLTACEIEVVRLAAREKAGVNNRLELAMCPIRAGIVEAP